MYKQEGDIEWLKCLSSYSFRNLFLVNIIMKMIPEKWLLACHEVQDINVWLKVFFFKFHLYPISDWSTKNKVIVFTVNTRAYQWCCGAYLCTRKLDRELLKEEYLYFFIFFYFWTLTLLLNSLLYWSPYPQVPIINLLYIQCSFTKYFACAIILKRMAIVLQNVAIFYQQYEIIISLLHESLSQSALPD